MTKDNCSNSLHKKLAQETEFGRRYIFYKFSGLEGQMVGFWGGVC